MATERIERHPRSARRFHAAGYLSTTVLLVTGWWLLLGGEGHPSPFATLTGVADTVLHVWVGRLLAVLVVAPIVFAWRGVRTFARETLRVDRGDASWFRRWPRAVFDGRFGRHEGRFDPGQRVANLVLVAGLITLTVTGLGLTILHGGPTFAVLARVHEWTAIALTPVILGHVAIAAGVLPGYRGAWRAMHLGGRIDKSTARRLWPGWTERTLVDDASRRGVTESATRPG
jgi:cytochrome b subunit of formate dehydrogenase